MLGIKDLTDEQLRRLWEDCNAPVSSWPDEDLEALSEEDPDPPDEGHKGIVRALAAEVLRLRLGVKNVAAQGRLCLGHLGVNDRQRAWFDNETKNEERIALGIPKGAR